MHSLTVLFQGWRRRWCSLKSQHSGGRNRPISAFEDSLTYRESEFQSSEGYYTIPGPVPLSQTTSLLQLFFKQLRVMESTWQIGCQDNYRVIL